MKSQSFDREKELREQSPKDWKFGAITSIPGIVIIPRDELAEFLPKGETQFSKYADFTDCASRSPLNDLEADFTFHYYNGMLPENKSFFEKNGYMEDGRIVFSDRYIAIKSGTTKQGNSLKAPLEEIRKGLIPKSMLPKTEEMTWEEYHDKSKVTKEMDALAADFESRFRINYEQVNAVHFAEVLKDDMIGVAAHAWPLPINGVYPRTENSENHAFLLYDLPKYQAFDNYYDFTDDGKQIIGDFTKNLAPDYKFFDYGYRVFISLERNAREAAAYKRAKLELLQRLFSLLTLLLSKLVVGAKTIYGLITR